MHGGRGRRRAMRRNRQVGLAKLDPRPVLIAEEVDANLHLGAWDAVGAGIVLQADEQAVVHALAGRVHLDAQRIVHRVVVHHAHVLPALDFGPAPVQVGERINIAAARRRGVGVVHHAVTVAVFPQLAVAVDVRPIVQQQPPHLIFLVVAVGVQLGQREVGRHHQQVGPLGDVADGDEVVRRVEVVHAFGRGRRAEEGDDAAVKAAQRLSGELDLDRVVGGVGQAEGLGVGQTGIDDVGEAGVLSPPVVTHSPLIRHGHDTLAAGGDVGGVVGVDRTRALGHDIGASRYRARLEDGARLGIGGPAAVLGLKRLVDQGQVARRDRRRTARAAPGFPGRRAVADTVELSRARASVAVGDHVHADLAARRRTPVGEGGRVTVLDLGGACDRVPARRAVHGRRADGNTDLWAVRGIGAVARPAVTGRVHVGHAGVQLAQVAVNPAAAVVPAVVVYVRGAVAIAENLDVVVGAGVAVVAEERQVVGVNSGHVKVNVGVAHRHETGQRGRAQVGAEGLVAAAQVGETRDETRRAALADDRRTAQRTVEANLWVKVAHERDQGAVAGRWGSPFQEQVGDAGDASRSVSDEVDHTA